MRSLGLCCLTVVVVAPALADEGPADTQYRLGMMYKEKGRGRDARAKFKEAIRIDADHAGARRELGYVRVGENWVKPKPGEVVFKGRVLTLDDAFRRADGYYERRYYRSLGRILKAIKASSSEPGTLARCDLLRAMVYERKGQWDRAKEILKGVIRTCESGSSRGGRGGRTAGAGASAAEVARAHLAVIEENPDGMYTVKEGGGGDLFSMDDDAGKRTKTRTARRPLTERKVMDAALRDKSKTVIDEGRRVLKDAERTEIESGDKARGMYREALRKFAAAESIAKGTARSFQIEATRKLIGLEEKRFNEGFRKARASVAGVGTRRAFARKLKTAASHLTVCEDACEKILGLAKPFHEELKTMIDLANSNKGRIDELKRALRSSSAGLR